MSAPGKPWESNFNGRVLQSSSSVPNVVSTPVGRMRMTPPVPPRPNSMGVAGASQYNTGYNNYGSYGMGYSGGYSSSYSPYSSYNSYGSHMGGYGGFGGYSGYSSYGGPMNRFGYNGPESSFIQIAEESTRPAFQSIESVVRAFSGISMMMDSTFFAITSSFRAVLGIADNIGQLRSMFGQIWSSFALFRLIAWAYRKLLAMFGIQTGVIGGNQAWEQATNGDPNGPAVPNRAGHNWPIFLFLGIILSAPYLISKMIPSIDEKRRLQSQWPSPGVLVKVVYDFQAQTPQELTVRSGDTITVAPRAVQEEMGLMTSGWVYVARNGTTGIVPRNYLQPPVKNTEYNRDLGTGESTVPQSTLPQVPEKDDIVNESEA